MVEPKQRRKDFMTGLEGVFFVVVGAVVFPFVLKKIKGKKNKNDKPTAKRGKRVCNSH